MGLHYVVAFVFLLCEVDFVTSTIQDDRNPGFLFNNHPGYLLSLPTNMTNITQTTTKVSDKMQCVFVCTGTCWCRSVNFKITAEMDHYHICELMATDDYTNGKDMKQDEEFTHLSIKNPCEDIPCLNGGKCITDGSRLDYRCQCTREYIGDNCQNVAGSSDQDAKAKTIISYRNCSDIYKSGERRNGVYTIQPDSQGTFQVYCDMTTDGGGWTVFQRRQDGSVDFYLGWQQYKTGFGNLTGEFWLGNDYIHRLTAAKTVNLRIDLENQSGTKKYAKYGSFDVGDESDKYRLNISSYSGTAGDSLAYHNGRAFTTKDQDNDLYSQNCAVVFTGAWWYKTCHYSNLNGQYLETSTKGLSWYFFQNSYAPMRFSEMKLRHLE